MNECDYDYTFGYTVFEKDKARDSVVLDQNGVPYKITSKKRPIGFYSMDKNNGKD